MNKTSQAKIVFDYLNYRDELKKVDAIIGFGHFDLKIPKHCTRLYFNNWAPVVIFSGGLGSGTADLGEAEADIFKKEALKLNLSEDKILVENKPTNTPECVEYIKGKLKEKEIKSVIIVANAYRQWRVYLTCKKMLPEIDFINNPPETTFKEELELFKAKGRDYFLMLIREIECIINYGEKGDILKIEIPDDIIEAYRNLKNLM